jgi:hypothetical protein
MVRSHQARPVRTLSTPGPRLSVPRAQCRSNSRRSAATAAGTAIQEPPRRPAVHPPRPVRCAAPLDVGASFEEELGDVHVPLPMARCMGRSSFASGALTSELRDRSFEAKARSPFFRRSGGGRGRVRPGRRRGSIPCQPWR